jgi:hypothetical protein
MLIVLMPVLVGSQSYFGHSPFGFGGFAHLHDYDFHNHGYGRRAGSWNDRHFFDDDDEYGFGSPYSTPCPHYEPLQTSEWRESSDQQLKLRVSLPSVQHESMDAWLGKDGNTVHVRGIRALAVHGRRCLPKEARVSSDGQYEILEIAVTVPAEGDAQKSHVRHVQGGLQIDVPKRPRPCPQYEPLQTSEWRDISGLKLGLRVSLPNVEYENMDVRLGKDGTTMHVRGVRGLPVYGRRCLPRGAHMSSDGRYEILEVDVSVPAEGDAQKNHVRHVRGGLQIEVPRRARPPMPPSRRHSKRNGATAQDAQSGSIHAETQQVSAQDTAQSSPLKYNSVRPMRLGRPARTSIVLPPSTGIHVEDADFPWPDKNEDASEGWTDNRGESQSY